MRTTLRVVLGLLVVTVVGAACKDTRPEFARRSEREVPANIRVAREGLDQLTRSFTPILDQLATGMAPSVQSGVEDRVRFQLIEARTRQVQGGSMTLFPTAFIAAVSVAGTAIARDIARDDDFMRALPMATMFTSVRHALDGHSAISVGELAATADQPARVLMVAASPIRAEGGAVVGTLCAGIRYGDLSRALEQAIRARVGTRPVLWVSLVRNGRVLPSGRDRDVPPRWLVPQPLIAQIPRDAAARLTRGNGLFTWNFIEGETRPWGAGMGTLDALEGTNVLIFRSEPDAR